MSAIPDVAGLTQLGVRPTLGVYFRQLWDRREFASTVTMSSLRASNQDTVLGNAWHLLSPLMLAGVFYIVFGVLFDQRGGPNYLGFLVVGLFTFTYTRKAITSGAGTVVNNLDLLRSISFPRAVLPLSAVLGAAVGNLFETSAAALIVLSTGEPIRMSWLLLAPLFVLQTTMNIGLGFFTARLTFHIRDVEHVLPYVTRLWLYLSGIFYTIDRIPEGVWRRIFSWNPIVPFIEIARGALLGGGVDDAIWLRAVVWSAVALVGGFLFFWMHEIEYSRD